MRYVSASVLMKNMTTRIKDDEILTFDDWQNIIIENMTKTDTKILVTGEESEDIRLVNSKIKIDKFVSKNHQNNGFSLNH